MRWSHRTLLCLEAALHLRSPSWTTQPTAYRSPARIPSTIGSTGGSVISETPQLLSPKHASSIIQLLTTNSHQVFMYRHPPTGRPGLPKVALGVPGRSNQTGDGQRFRALVYPETDQGRKNCPVKGLLLHVGSSSLTGRWWFLGPRHGHGAACAMRSGRKRLSLT